MAVELSEVATRLMTSFPTTHPMDIGEKTTLIRRVSSECNVSINSDNDSPRSPTNYRQKIFPYNRLREEATKSKIDGTALTLKAAFGELTSRRTRVDALFRKANV